MAQPRGTVKLSDIKRPLESMFDNDSEAEADAEAEAEAEAEDEEDEQLFAFCANNVRRPRRTTGEVTVTASVWTEKVDGRMRLSYYDGSVHMQRKPYSLHLQLSSTKRWRKCFVCTQWATKVYRSAVPGEADPYVFHFGSAVVQGRYTGFNKGAYAIFMCKKMLANREAFSFLLLAPRTVLSLKRGQRRKLVGLRRSLSAASRRARVVGRPLAAGSSSVAPAADSSSVAHAADSSSSSSIVPPAAAAPTSPVAPQAAAVAPTSVAAPTVVDLTLESSSDEEEEEAATATADGDGNADNDSDLLDEPVVHGNARPLVYTTVCTQPPCVPVGALASSSSEVVPAVSEPEANDEAMAGNDGNTGNTGLPSAVARLGWSDGDASGPEAKDGTSCGGDGDGIDGGTGNCVYRAVLNAGVPSSRVPRPAPFTSLRDMIQQGRERRDGWARSVMIRRLGAAAVNHVAQQLLLHDKVLHCASFYPELALLVVMLNGEHCIAIRDNTIFDDDRALRFSPATLRRVMDKPVYAYVLLQGAQVSTHGDDVARICNWRPSVVTI